MIAIRYFVNRLYQSELPDPRRDLENFMAMRLSWLTDASTAPNIEDWEYVAIQEVKIISDLLNSLKNRQIGLVFPPGSRLICLAEFLLTQKSYHEIVVPIISDMREEYFEALSQNRIWKARWVRVRGTWSFFAALGLDRFFSIVSMCVKVWKSVN
jgi:hypothetical protein